MRSPLVLMLTGAALSTIAAVAPAAAQSVSKSLRLKGTVVEMEYHFSDDDPAIGGSFLKRVKCSSSLASAGASTTSRTFDFTGCPDLCIDHVEFNLNGRAGQAGTDDGSNPTYRDGQSYAGSAAESVLSGTVTGEMQGTATGFPDPQTEGGALTFTYREVIGNVTHLCSFTGSYKAKY